jgi:hypothetical protein
MVLNDSHQDIFCIKNKKSKTEQKIGKKCCQCAIVRAKQMRFAKKRIIKPLIVNFYDRKRNKTLILKEESIFTTKGINQKQILLHTKRKTFNYASRKILML